MSAFQSAVASGDVGKVAAQMCTEEAALLEGLSLPPGATIPVDDGSSGQGAVALADIQVKGTAASASVTGSPVAANKIYFRKEGGQWKVCSAAKADF